jgi:uncharacterized membrane protein HdeD (DUF308 family)
MQTSLQHQVGARRVLSRVPVASAVPSVQSEYDDSIQFFSFSGSVLLINEIFIKLTFVFHLYCFKIFFKSKNTLRCLFVFALRERIPVLCIYFCGVFGLVLGCVFRNAPVV